MSQTTSPQKRQAGKKPARRAKKRTKQNQPSRTRSDEASVKPFYQDPWVTLYCGDCRELLPLLRGAWDVCITDPVWPNTKANLIGSDDPIGLFAQVGQLLEGRIKRLVVQLGGDSDPRILSGVPSSLPFFRTCWLEYVRPHYKGRLLYTSDVAYVFGPPPPSRRGAHLIPGHCIQNDSEKRPASHPCPRQLMHVDWLVQWFGEGTIIDPFAGVGTTLVAAKYGGYKAVGIEVEPRFCEAAVERLLQGVLDFDANKQGRTGRRAKNHDPGN